MSEKKIMIIDDDKEFLAELEETLSASGYKSIAVNDSKLALEIALQEKPKVALIDLKMPKKNGFELADEINRAFEAADVSIIAMSAFFNEEFISLMNLCGIKKFIRKPFYPLDLISSIEEIRREKDLFPVINQKHSLLKTHQRDRRQAIQLAIEDITKREAKGKITRRHTKELKRNNLELRQFAATASHDLVAPLSIVMGYVKLFNKKYRGTLDTQAGQSLEKIAENLNRMQNLIGSVLENSYVERKTKFDTFDSGVCYKEATLNLEQIIKEKNASVTCDKLPGILGNQVQITQLFQSLINNGLKFNENISPNVHVSSELSDKGWVFSFKDNGIGIKPEDMGLIFKMFYRLHSRAEYDGTGIGLSTCKKIVISHRGKILASSKLGWGSTFYFSIPAKGALSPSRV
jgi:signal transduction histidine kinase